MAGELSPLEIDVFGPWLKRWQLIVEGAPISGPNSQLLPVRRGELRLMLKAAMQPREVRAAAYLEWLDGNGAVEVVEREQDAVLMERVIGTRSLVEIDAAGNPERSFALLCDVGDALHAARGTVPDEVLPLSIWLQRLTDVATSSEFFSRMARTAALLLSTQQDIQVLHGDLHHWNVLDGGTRGWLAIDPNGIRGDRAFDFALMVLPTNITEDTEPKILAARSRMVAELARIDQQRLLKWVAVQAALWAAWSAPGRDWIAIAEAAEKAAAD